MRGAARAGALLLALAACGETAVAPLSLRPEAPGLGAALAPGPVRVANADLAEDFTDLVFFPENGRPLEGLLRFEGPVRVALASDGLRPYAADLDATLARIRAGAGLDIARTDDDAEAQIRIVLAPRRQMVEVFPGAQCFIVPAALSWSGFLRDLRRGSLPEWRDLSVLTAATIFIPTGSAPNSIRECFEEEVAQALGPTNDLFRLPDTVFNDDNVHTRLTPFDLLMLRVLYDPALRPGMGRAEARAAARAVLAAANPAGSALPRRRTLAPQPRWERLMADLFSGTLAPSARREALTRAAALARGFPQPDHRLAFSLDMLASLEYDARPDLAEALLARALASLERTYPARDLRIATIRLYLAQTRLRLGRPAEALPEVEAALPVLVAHDAALRIAHALQVRASALAALGRDAEAEAARAEGLRWARYVSGDRQTRLDLLAERLDLLDPGPGGTREARE